MPVAFRPLTVNQARSRFISLARYDSLHALMQFRIRTRVSAGKPLSLAPSAASPLRGGFPRGGASFARAYPGCEDRNQRRGGYMKEGISSRFTLSVLFCGSHPNSMAQTGHPEQEL